MVNLSKTNNKNKPPQHKKHADLHLPRVPDRRGDGRVAALPTSEVSSYLVDLGGPVVGEPGEDGGNPERSHAAALCVALLRARDEASDVLCPRSFRFVPFRFGVFVA